MKKALRYILIGLVYTFLYAPLLVMAFFSFNATKSTSVFSGFSLHWYDELFKSAETMEALGNTLLLAVLSAVIATVIGTLAAVGIYKMRSKALSSVVMGVTNVPMMNPDIVTGVSLMLLFVFVGRLMGASTSLSFWTLLIAHITFNIPYVILNVLPKLRQTDPHLLMAFTLSLDDFVISYYTNGTDFQTLPLRIYSMTKKTVKPDMYALSTIIFVTILVLLLLSNLLQEKSEKKNTKG